MNTPQHQHQHQSPNSKNTGGIHIGAVSNDVNFNKESVKGENELSLKPQTFNESNDFKKEYSTDCPIVTEDNSGSVNTIPIPSAIIEPIENNSVHDHSVEERITLPPKLPDPGAPIVSIQVGDLKIDKALLDLGACVSILQGKLYD